MLHTGEMIIDDETFFQKRTKVRKTAIMEKQKVDTPDATLLQPSPMFTTEIENGALHSETKSRAFRFYHNPFLPPSINAGGSG